MSTIPMPGDGASIFPELGCEQLKDTLPPSGNCSAQRTGHEPDSNLPSSCQEQEDQQGKATATVAGEANLQQEELPLAKSQSTPDQTRSGKIRHLTQAEPRSAQQSRSLLPADSGRELNRIREVREQQGVSIRSMARRLGVDLKTCRALEDPKRDLSLSELHAIQSALDVPLCDLLEDRQSLSRPVEERAKMIKIMKTAVALRETKSNSRVQRMAQMLCEQLIDLMPELEEVGGWPQFGARRGKSALGRVLAQQVDMSQLPSE